MPPALRPSAVVVAAALIGGRRYTSVYTYAARTWLRLEAEIEEGRVRAFDFARSAKIEGRLPSPVRDFGDHSDFRFELIGRSKVLGHHFGSRSFFEVTSEDAGAPSEVTVKLYDFETGERETYLVK